MSDVLEYRLVGAVDEMSLAIAVQAFLDNPPVGSVWKPLGAPFVRQTVDSSSNYSNTLQASVLSNVNSFEHFFQAMVRYSTR